MRNADVVVVGSGPAGIAAAVTAARCGLKTILLEKDAFVGGIPVKGHITTLCGLYVTPAEKKDPLLLHDHDGITREFISWLMDHDGVRGPIRMGRAYVLLCRPKSFAAAARWFVQNEPALTICCESEFCSAEVIDGRIESIAVDCKDHRYRIKPGAVIDASGDAVVCRATGTWLIDPETRSQVPALIFPLHHVALNENSAIGAARRHLIIRNAVEKGALPPEALAVSFMPSLEPDSLIVKLNLGLLIKADYQMPEKKLGHSANELKNIIVWFLRQHGDGFEKCTTPAVASLVLHRESVRGVGGYVLCVQDVLSARKFPDAVAKGCWPVEKWDEKGTLSVKYIPDGEYYEIPRQALQSVSIDNLFMAGKSISADSGAIASARVIGCCFATGEAAAKLAAERI